MESHDLVIVFVALLAILCQVFVVSTVVFGLSALGSGSARASLRSVADSFLPIAAPLAFVIAVVTMSGSLYMSEIKHFRPCHLCWIQRGLLYPQVIWTLLLWIKPDLTWIRRLAILMLAGCIGVSTYHYILEYYPTLETSVCAKSNPCSLLWFRQFGFVSLPLMALTSATTVLTLLVISSQGVFRPRNFVLGSSVISIVTFLTFLFIL